MFLYRNNKPQEAKEKSGCKLWRREEDTQRVLKPYKTLNRQILSPAHFQPVLQSPDEQPLTTLLSTAFTMIRLEDGVHMCK